MLAPLLLSVWARRARFCYRGGGPWLFSGGISPYTEQPACRERRSRFIRCWQWRFCIAWRSELWRSGGTGVIFFTSCSVPPPPHTPNIAPTHLRIRLNSLAILSGRTALERTTQGCPAPPPRHLCSSGRSRRPLPMARSAAHRSPKCGCTTTCASCPTCRLWPLINLI